MRIAGIPFYPANASNYSKGRIKPIKHVTVHHSAGWENTLRYLWADPNRNASSTFWVGTGHSEQYVDTDDTPYTNGNWYSNSESITIEVRGDWRGYYSLETLLQLRELLKKIRKAYPTTTLTYHQDVSDAFTLCPADLKHKGYAKAQWDEVTKWLNSQGSTAPTPPVSSKITYKKITPKRVKLIRTASLWDFNFTDWAKAKAIKTYNQGDVIDVVAEATNALGGKYYLTAYSYNDGNIRSTNGFNVKDTEDYKPVITAPPTVEPKWEKMDNPRKLVTAMDLKVFDLTLNKEVGDTIPKGTEVNFDQKKTTKANRMYLRSVWSTTNNKDWGLPIDSLIELSDVPREPVPEPPINVDPETPTDSDVVKRLTALESIVKAIVDFLTGLFSGFKVK